MNLKSIIKIVLAWRIVLSIAALVAGFFVVYKPSFPYGEVLLEPLGPRAVSSWGNFDGVHYLTIIERGYVGTGAIQAFFPLFPQIVKSVSIVIGNPLIAGLLVSTSCFAVALYFLFKLVRLDEDKKTAQRVMWLVLFFPTAFFFTSLYTESLFLLEVVLAFYYARKKQWIIASLFTIFASATKVTGILLVPALLIEYYEQIGTKKMVIWEKIKTTTTLLLGGSGLAMYMLYLKKVFGDPLLFLHVQSQFGSGRETEKFILLYQVFWRYIKMIATVPVQSLVFYTVAHEFIITILFLGLLISAFWYVRKSYVVFGLISMIVPTLTGTLTSMPRYVLVLFPAFMVLAKIVPERFYKSLLVFFGILLFINTILFIQGYWVA